MSNQEDLSLDKNYRMSRDQEKQLQGARLRVAIIEAGMTREGLAEKISCSVSTLDKWLSGHHCIPFNRHRAITKALGKHRYYLLDGVPDKFVDSTYRLEDVVLSLFDAMDREQQEQWILLGYRLVRNTDLSAGDGDEE